MKWVKDVNGRGEVEDKNKNRCIAPRFERGRERNEYLKITALLPAYHRTAPSGRAFINSHSTTFPIRQTKKMYHLPRPNKHHLFLLFIKICESSNHAQVVPSHMRSKAERK